MTKGALEAMEKGGIYDQIEGGLLLKKLRKDGVLYHQVLPSSTLKVKAYLEDYSFLM